MRSGTADHGFEEVEKGSVYASSVEVSSCVTIVCVVPFALKISARGACRTSRSHLQIMPFGRALLDPVSQPKNPNEESGKYERYGYCPIHPEPGAYDLHTIRGIPVEEGHGK